VKARVGTIMNKVECSGEGWIVDYGRELEGDAPKLQRIVKVLGWGLSTTHMGNTRDDMGNWES